jgi:hypothetical protein
LETTASSDAVVSGASGQVHGGQSPIQASAVTLYVTSSTATGYGQAANVIGTATTDSNGNFTINTPATSSNCPAGSQAYITAAGGYPSGSPSLQNNSMLEMVALGDCSGVSASTFVVLNEVTTVAAAYALSGFMSTSASGSVYKANVSAPAANSATTGTVTPASAGTPLTATAAGLKHAFLNAANLASAPQGTANTATSALTIGTATITGTVPATEINTLADILQSCVDSATGSTACTTLFSDTPSITGVAPTNTLQAMINLARNPYPNATAMGTSATSIFGMISASPAFLPDLTSAPPDWALSIVYRPAGTTVFYHLTLDANDTLYAGYISAANILAMSPYGTSTPAFTAGTGSATRQVAVDTLGNVWVGNNNSLLLQYSATAGGAPTSTYTFPLTSGSANGVSGVAVDASNNVWVGDATAGATSANIIEMVRNSTTGAYAANYTATTPSTTEPVTLRVDASQNVWAADYYLNTGASGGIYAVMLPNLSAATPTATPTYANSGTTATPVYVQFAGGSDGSVPIDMQIDASGNAWYQLYYGGSPTTVGIEEVTPNLTNSVVTSLTPQSFIGTAALGTKAVTRSAIDGAGTLFLPDNGGLDGIHMYSTLSSTSSSDTSSQVISQPAGVLGCAIASGATTCGAIGSTASAIYNPRGIAIDSTGAVWSTNTTNAGGVTQTIGLAAPTWPLMLVGKPGLSPGATTVTPLP